MVYFIFSRNKYSVPGMVAHAWDPKISKAEAGGTATSSGIFWAMGVTKIHVHKHCYDTDLVRGNYNEWVLKAHGVVDVKYIH